MFSVHEKRKIFSLDDLMLIIFGSALFLILLLPMLFTLTSLKRELDVVGILDVAISGPLASGGLIFIQRALDLRNVVRGKQLGKTPRGFKLVISLLLVMPAIVVTDLSTVGSILRYGYPDLPWLRIVF